MDEEVIIQNEPALEDPASETHSVLKNSTEDPLLDESTVNLLGEEGEEKGNQNDDTQRNKKEMANHFKRWFKQRSPGHYN